MTGDVKRKQIEKAKQLGIGKRYSHVSLANFIAKTPAQAEAKQAVKEIFGDLRDQLLIIYGASGAGKTHLLCAGLLMLDEDVQRSYTGGYYFYITMPWLAIHIRSTYSSSATYGTEDDILAGLNQMPILVIDDVGKSKDLGAEQDWINYLVFKRHANFLPTVLATNKLFATKSLNESIKRRATKIVTI